MDRALPHLWVLRRYRSYPILYLAFHGLPGGIHVRRPGSRNHTLTLDDIEEVLEGRCRQRFVYFGSCNTLSVSPQRLKRFLKTTGALAVCGYTVDIDWLKSSAFDLLAFAAMQENTLTVQGAEAIKRRIQREAGGLAKELKFRMVVR